MKGSSFYDNRTDPADSVRCVAELRSERYAFERYVEFWRLLAFELFDGDEEATNILYVLTASRVLTFLESSKCELPHKDIETSKEYLRKNVLAEGVLLEGMNLLTNYHPFWANFFDVIHTATVGSALIDELLRLETGGQQDYRSRPSLAKALANLRADKEFGGQWSLSSWKGIWRDYATDLPMTWAIYEMDVDLRGLSGEDPKGVERYQELVAKSPDYFSQLLSLAKAAQLKMLELIDPSSKANKKFFRYPREIPTVKLSGERSRKTFEELDRRYGDRETT